MLTVIRPVEILFCNFATETPLNSVATAQFPESKCLTIERRYFSEAKGAQFVESHEVQGAETLKTFDSKVGKTRSRLWF